MASLFERMNFRSHSGKPTGVTEDDKARKDRFWINVWRVYALLVVGFMLFLLIALIVESIRVWLA